MHYKKLWIDVGALHNDQEVSLKSVKKSPLITVIIVCHANVVYLFYFL